jgi:hypothetical protein
MRVLPQQAKLSVTGLIAVLAANTPPHMLSFGQKPGRHRWGTEQPNRFRPPARLALAELLACERHGRIAEWKSVMAAVNEELRTSSHRS